MRAEVTYNAGKTCSVGGVKFKEGVTRVVSDPDLIRYCQNTHGFAVHVLKEKKVVPVESPKKVIPVEDEDAAPTTRKGKRSSREG